MEPRYRQALAWVGSVLVAGMACAPAFAQSFVNTQVGAIDNTVLCDTATGGNGTSTYLTRTFNVSGIGTIADLDVGLIATHTYRGDIRLELAGPTGGFETIISTEVNNTGFDNYNIRLDDASGNAINTAPHNAGADDVNAAPYQFRVRPSAAGALSAFNGRSGADANGTWTLRICDDFNQDNGQLRRAELIFGQLADLQLDVTASTDTPAQNGSTTLTYTLANSGPGTAEGVNVAVALPAGYSVATSTPSQGTFANGLWTVGNVANGQSPTLTLSVNVGTASGLIEAEVSAMDNSDPDSAPNNGNTSEDDYASVGIYPQNPSAPNRLSCAVGQTYDMRWATSGANTWPAPGGSQLSNSYVARDNDPATADIPLSLTMSAPGGNAAAVGFFAGAATQPSPRTRTGWTAGTSGLASLYVGVALPNLQASSKVSMTMDLGIPAEGVEAFQFIISDIDQGAYRDRITVNGFANGQPVGAPVLTRASAVAGTGNVAVTDGTSGNQPATSSNGNVTVRFNEPVDQIVFTYDNGPGATEPSGTQAIALQDIEICRRLLPDVEATKTVAVYDPQNQGLYMTPGNEVEYFLTVVNKGPVEGGTAEGDAEDITLSDTLPSNLKFVSAVASGFTGGSIVTEPQPNTDCDATPCEVSFSGGTLDVDETGVLTIRALIK